MRPRNDPVRLSADLNAPARLRDLLAQGRRSGPTETDLQRLSSRVQAAIIAGVPAPNLTPIGKAGFTGLAGKIGVVAFAAVAAVVGGTLWVARHSTPVVATSKATGASASVSAVANSLHDEVEPVDHPSASPPESSLPTPDTSSRSLGPTSSNSSITSVGRDGAASTANESVLLNMARSALRSNPRHALALTQEHVKRFANGALVQEREVIAIEALSRLGQLDAARARARDFERRFPGSAHQSKIDQLTRDK